jgi:hypothetical protein
MDIEVGSDGRLRWTSEVSEVGGSPRMGHQAIDA